MNGLHCTHDLLGSMQRLTNMRNELRDEVAKLRESWKDKKALEFENEHLLPIEPVLMGAITSIADLAELSGDIQKKIRESENMI
jgi:hypothetical protein